MNEARSAGVPERGSQTFFMLISAGVFAYFGFGTTWNHHSVIDGRFLLFVALLDWTLKGAAIGCGLAAVLTFIKLIAAEMLYAIVGLLSAILFVVVGVMDIADTQHAAMSPLLLFIFAVWNGYGSWSSLMQIMAARRTMMSSQANSQQP